VVAHLVKQAKLITICPIKRLLQKLNSLSVRTGIWKKYVRFEVFTAVTMKNCVFWDVTPCGSCKNRRFGGT
jgi:hypothetical protein